MIAIAIAAALSLSVAACGSGGEGTDSGGSNAMVTIAMPSPISLDAEISQNGTILDNFYQPLVYWDPADESQLEPILAESLPAQVSPTVWEVKLRSGVEFSNGEPFNAEAAAFSINHFIDPATNAGNANELETVVKAEAIDDSTIHITTTAPDPILPSRLTRVYMIPPKYALTDDFATHPVGTGPYTFVDYQPGQYLDMTRNDGYWGDAPTIEKAQFKFITDNQAMVAALTTGQVDLAYNVIASSKDAVPQFIEHDGLNNAYLRMKTYEGPLQNEKLRQAIAYVADSSAYAKNIYNGTATPLQCQVMDATVTGFNPDLQAYPADTAKAKQLVEESGYDGTPVTINAPTDWLPLVSPMIESLSNSMNSIGIKTSVELVPRDVWSKAILAGINQGQPDITFSAASTELHDADKLSSITGADASMSADPDPTITEKLNAARTELDADQRVQTYHEITKQICDEARLIALYQLKNTWGAAENLEWTPQADGNARVAAMQFKN